MSVTKPGTISLSAAMSCDYTYDKLNITIDQKIDSLNFQNSLLFFLRKHFPKVLHD